MGEIGKILQSRREDLGLSLDEMEHKTKIRKRYLEAIEVDDWSLLPGHVYARGFVRSYADHLGMDGRALLMEHDANPSPETPSASDEGHMERNQMRGAQQDAVTARHSRRSHTTPPRNRTSAGPRFASQSGGRRGHKAGNSSKGWVGQAVAVVAILAALGAGWWWITQKAHPVKPYTASSNPNPNHTTTGGSGSLAASGVSSGGNKGSNTTNPSSKPAGQVPNSTVAKPKLVTTVTPKPIQGNRLTYVVTSPHPLQVVLSANARLWTTVTADGVSLDGGGGQVLSQGDSKPFTAKNSLTFVIGNLPAATFDVDGKTIVLPNLGRTLNVSFVKG